MPWLLTVVKVLKNKTLALAYTKLVPGSNWNALVCSLCKKNVDGANWTPAFCFFFPSQFQAKVMWLDSSYVLCAVVFCRQHLSVCLFDQELFLCEAVFCHLTETLLYFWPVKFPNIYCQWEFNKLSVGHFTSLSAPSPAIRPTYLWDQKFYCWNDIRDLYICSWKDTHRLF